MCVATMSMAAQTQDTITFTWRGGVNKSFAISVGWSGSGSGASVIIDWGDGCVEANKQPIHTYIDTNYYTVNVIVYSTTIIWHHFDCSSMQLSSLNFSSGIFAPLFTVYNATLYCNNNQLPLSDLYAVSGKVSTTNAKLGPQFLQAQQVVVDDIVDYSSQVKFNTTNTVFVVEKDYVGGTQAVINVDYTINNGIIVFKKSGKYFVSMTNTAIKTDQNYPAIVYAEFNVRDFNTDASLSNLTISKGKLTPTFHSGTLNYAVNTPYSISEINITAIANDTNAKVSGDIGTQQLNVGVNIFTIRVTAEDKTTMQNYTITVNRADTIIDSTGIREIIQEKLIVSSIEIFDILGRKYVTRHCEHSEAIQNIDGQWIASGYCPRNDVMCLPSGIYIIKIHTDNGIITKKISIIK